jgi:hypothetical protein
MVLWLLVFSLPDNYYIMYGRVVIPAPQALYHGHFLWAPLVAFDHKFLVEDAPWRAGISPILIILMPGSKSVFYSINQTIANLQI